MADDLFEAAADDAMGRRAPLAERLRPTRLDDVVGQDHLLGRGRPLRRLVDGGRLASLILWGPPGTGKTTLARLLATSAGCHFELLSAVSATVKDIRAVADAAHQRLGERSVATVLFLDEIHRFTRTQQDALLPHVELGLLTLIGATTESPWATVNRPLLSRCTVFQLQSLDDRALRDLVARGSHELGVRIEPAAIDHLVAGVEGDGRRLLVALDLAAQLATGRAVADQDVVDALGAGAGHYDTTDHYDAASAFIKHLRASDPEQALAWLQRMLDGGEDPRFIARRMLIFASEDIGPADPTALLVAEAAARATEFVGMPEARYNLGHAALTLARAPKSREVVDELFAAEGREVAPPPATGHHG